MLKAVIFDMDGVIVDSEPMHFEIDKRVLSCCNVNVTDEILLPYVGASNMVMWKELKDKFDLKLSVDELIELQTEIKKRMLNETELVPISGIRELLDDLRQNNIALAVASSSPRYFIEGVLDKTNIRGFFKDIISGEEVQRGKPFPDIFMKMAEILEVKPEECIVIEDSTNGTRAAFAAGMKCIGFINPNSGPQDLSSAAAIVNSICDISCNYLKNIAL